MLRIAWARIQDRPIRTILALIMAVAALLTHNAPVHDLPTKLWVLAVVGKLLLCLGPIHLLFWVFYFGEPKKHRKKIR